MDKLRICKNNRVFFGGEEVKRDSVNFTEFLIANLESEVELEEGITTEEVVHFFYECKDFVYAYFSEHYEVLRALITVKNLQNHYGGLKISKKIHIDEGYISIVPCVDFLKPIEGQQGSNALGKIVVVLDESLSLMEDDIFIVENDRTLKQELKSVITLLDVMRALFDDLTLVLEDSIVSL